MNDEVEREEIDAARVETDPGKNFLVVGIGASAGGVSALKQFFSAVPDEPGMAFVVILHLSQQHKSNLAEILQRETRMPVRQVTETVTVEPDHVFVIPPGRHLQMVDGVIRLETPARVRGRRVPIDRFLRSLAEAYGRRAVSIILSGTGSDGTLGVRHIKGHDGFAIVQDPNDAEYDGMPVSAIQTRVVDIVLPVAAMPAKLLAVRDSTERLRLIDGNENKLADGIRNIDALRDVLSLIKARTGHDFSNYKRQTVIRRVARHLQVHETDDLRSYLTILRHKPDEVASLVKNLLINVTNFFRDKKAFDALEERVIPELFRGKTGLDTVRVWVPGCSSGEEAYSIAILLHEHAGRYTEPPKIQIFASDIDEDAIAEAREGCYTEAIVADVSAQRLERYFAKEDDNTYRVRKPIRETVLFAHHNVLRDPPFSHVDLVSCRNVMIYLNRESQEKVLLVFHFALKHGGYLFLGGSESAESQAGSFTTVDKAHRIFRARPAQGWHPPPRLAAPESWSTRIRELPVEARRPLPPLGQLHRRLIEEYAPPSVLVGDDGEILHLSENAGRFLRFAAGNVTLNLLKVVHPALLGELRAALFAAKKSDRPIEARNIKARIDGEDRSVTLIVRALRNPEGAALVMFAETDAAPGAPQDAQAVAAGDEAEAVVRRLEDELQRTKDHLRQIVEDYETAVEEQKASNEEMQAMNEELRSTAEELETGKEELQSVNEELTTVNSELKEKVDEASRVNSDLQNLLASTDIATIFLDKNIHIARYTPRATELFNLIPTDIGRPLEHITHRFAPDGFAAAAQQTLQTLAKTERELSSDDGRTYLARLVPYRGADDRIDGLVLTFVEITERKRAEQAIADDLAATSQLRDVAARLVTEDNIDKVYEKILSAAIAITRSDAGTVQVYDPRSRELVLLVTRGFEPKMTDHFHRVSAESETSCGIALRSGARSFVDFDPDNIEDVCQMHVEAGYRSAQSTPLVSRSGAPIGMLNTHWREPKHRPGERELRFLDLLARQAADLIEHRRAEAALRESEAHLATELADARRLQKISSLVLADGDAAEIYGKIVDAAIETMRADFGSIQILWPETGELHLLAWRNFDPSSAAFWERVRAESGSTCGAALLRGERVIVPDVESAGFMVGSGDLEHYRKSGIRASQTTPLLARDGRLVGMISTHWLQPHTPSERDFERFDVLARQAADLIEPRQAEAALRTSEEQFRRAVEDAPIPVIMYAEDGQVLQISKAWTELTGYGPRDVHNFDKWLDQAHVSGAEEVRRHMRELFKGQRRSLNIEFPVRTQAGGQRHWSFSASAPGMLRDGRRFIVGMALDVTDRKRAEEEKERLLEEARSARAEAEAAARLKDEFLATLSHELRAPLSNILGHAEALFGSVDAARVRRAAETIRRSALAQSQLVADLLDLSRLQTGKLALERRPIDLAATVAEAVEPVAAEAKAKDIELRTELRDEPMTVNADPVRVQQIVWNLVTNAIKFTPQGGKVTVTLHREGQHARLDIEDTGQGVAPEFLSHLFEMFRQGDSTTTRKHGGMGIGLALVRQLAELHGGRVEANSAGPGRGARFTVCLPIDATTQPDAETTPANHGAGSGQLAGLRILMVDDDGDAVTLFSELLEREGAFVHAATSGAEALQLAETSDFDIVVSDVSMPEMDGYELLRELRRRERTATVPAVAVTGFGRPVDAARARQAGFTSHVTKPAKFETVLEVIAAAMRRTPQSE